MKETVRRPVVIARRCRTRRSWPARAALLCRGASRNHARWSRSIRVCCPARPSTSSSSATSWRWNSKSSTAIHGRIRCSKVAPWFPWPTNFVRNQISTSAPINASAIGAAPSTKSMPKAWPSNRKGTWHWSSRLYKMPFSISLRLVWKAS